MLNKDHPKMYKRRGISICICVLHSYYKTSKHYSAPIYNSWNKGTEIVAELLSYFKNVYMDRYFDLYEGWYKGRGLVKEQLL